MIRTLATIALLFACGTSPAQHLESAKASMESGSWDGAVTAANDGLTAGPEPTVAWRLELVLLEAHARSGNAAESIKQIEKLATANVDRVNGKLYVSTAGQLKEGGDAPGAIDLLDAGAKRYPSDGEITQAIEVAKTTDDADELEALRSLGYIE